MIKIDVNIPVYNEGENISETLKSLDENIKSISDAEFIINIIYDFKEDNTLPVIERIQKEIFTPVKLVKNSSRGVVNALKTGFIASNADYVLVTMADKSDDYGILNDIVKIARNGVDLVCPSRYMKGGKLHGGPFIKQLISRIAGVSMHYISGIPTHDITNSYKLYKTSVLKNIELESKGGFEIGMEIAAKIFLNSGSIAEIPTEWRDRTKGKSRFKLLKWMPRYLKWYFFVIKGMFSWKRKKHK